MIKDDLDLYSEEEKEGNRGSNIFLFYVGEDNKMQEDDDLGLSKRDKETKREFNVFFENLKELLGVYLAKRKDSKFEIIENVIKMKVFEGKDTEVKFLQEALGHTKISDSMTSLQNTMKAKGILLSCGTVFIF